MKTITRAIERLGDADENQARVVDLKSLDALSRQAGETTDIKARRGIEARIAEIEQREGIKRPARTTVVNVVQLISRAFPHRSAVQP